MEAFVDAWNRIDMAAVVDFLAPDVFYHNVPLEPIQGRDQVAAYLDQVGPFEAVDWRILSIAAAGNKVLTERVDAFRVGGQRIALPLMGVFEIADGKISQWRDYFDLGDYLRQTGQGG